MRPQLFGSLWLISCAGVQLPREKLGTDPGGLLFNGYTRAEIACFSCHNGDARGATLNAPSLADPVYDQSDEQLRDTIKDGDGKMPAYKAKLSAEELAQLLAWLRASFPTAAPAAASAGP